MNKDQVKGRIEKAIGKLKEAAGRITGNQTLEQKGRIGKALGSVKAGYADLKDEVKKST